MPGEQPPSLPMCQSLWTDHRVWTKDLAAWGTGILAGFSTVLLVGRHPLLPPTPSVRAINRLAFTPDERGWGVSLLPLIGAAQKEIIIGARSLTSKALLDALNGRAKAGIDVKILLAGGDRTEGGKVAQWIFRNSVGRVYLEDAGLADQFVAVDGERAFFTSLPFTAEAPLKASAACLVIEDAGVVGKLRHHFLAHVSTLKPFEG